MGVGGRGGGFVGFVSLRFYPSSSRFLSLLGDGDGRLKFSENEE